MSDEIRAAERCERCNGTGRLYKCRRCGMLFRHIHKYSDCGTASCEGEESDPVPCTECGGRPPDGPPAAAPERQAGERWMMFDNNRDRWQIYMRDGGRSDRWIGSAQTKSDADLLVHGRDRLRAMEAALRVVCVEAESYIGIGFDHTDESAGLQKAVTAARAALGAGPVGGT